MEMFNLLETALKALKSRKNSAELQIRNIESQIEQLQKLKAGLESEARCIELDAQNILIGVHALDKDEAFELQGVYLKS